VCHGIFARINSSKRRIGSSGFYWIPFWIKRGEEEKLEGKREWGIEWKRIKIKRKGRGCHLAHPSM